MRCHVAWQKEGDVPNDPAALFFCTEDGSSRFFFIMLVLISQGTMHHIPGDSDLYSQLHENLKSDVLTAHCSGL